jgi:phenylalanyl-tRNA synthetase beta chain
VDLIEEIVRIVGFNSFIPIVPTIEKIGKFSKLEKLKRLLRKSFIELGFNEVLHYSLSTIQSKNQVELKNPIVPENSYFRSNLLNQLIQKAGINRKQKNNVLEAFEIGRVYSFVNENIIEAELISGIFGGNFYFSTWNEEGKLINWFEAKGLMEHIFSILGISPVWEKLQNQDINLLHPGRSAQLFINNKFLGVFGQIHPQLAKTNFLKDETFLFEFNLDVLKRQWQSKQIYNYKPYSLFPASLIDLACIKKNEISFKDVETKIREIGGPLLESVNLFDYYSGLPIPPGYHSLGFKLKFRKIDRTLTNEEVENIVKNIRFSLEKDFNIIIRK